MAFKNLACPSEAFNPQIVAGMARARELHAVELKPTAITVEGREEDLTAFANRLEQLRRLPVSSGDLMLAGQTLFVTQVKP